MKLKALILKDIYMLIDHCKMHFGIMILFLALFLFDGGKLFYLLYPAVLFAAIPMTLLSYDKHSKWNEYALTMPLKKSDLVIGKYIVSILSFLLLLIFFLSAIVINELINRTFSANTIITFLSILVSLFCLSGSINLPFIFRFGVEKGRLVYLATMGILGGLTAITANTPEGTKTFLSLSKLSSNPEITIMMMLFSIIIFGLSCFLSVKGFERNKT